MKPVYVTKAFLPPQEEYTAFLDQIWQSRILTNQGTLVQQLEKELEKRLEVPYFLYLCNGTVSLQLALHALGITGGEVITTPFSYVATTSAVLWERCRPVFVDIEREHYCIDPAKIEAAITPETKAILATHVFGFACDTEAIAKIARQHHLPVIYDGAHAFGCEYRGRPLLAYGDIAACSFHATKIFHTVEGGGCAVHDPAVFQKIDLARRFGHRNDDHFQVGINAKNSEFHAAMGLCNLKYFGQNRQARKKVSQWYDEMLPGSVVRPAPQKQLTYNYGYYPVLFRSENHLKQAFAKLAENQIFPRRYFYPSLNRLPYLHETAPCPVSEDIASRIACLPLYGEIERETVSFICKKIGEEI